MAVVALKEQLLKQETEKRKIRQGFQIGVALSITLREVLEKFLSATPKFLSATHIFGF